MRCIPRAGLRKDRDRLDTIPGTLPSLGAELPGCVYVDRCPIATPYCATEKPTFADMGNGHFSRCFYPADAPDIPRAADSDFASVSSHNNELAMPLLKLDRVSKTFGADETSVRVLTNVTLSLQPGETLGLVGESGSGKTTLAKVVLGLLPADAGGFVELDGKQLASELSKRASESVADVQIVFQNPDSALNRRHSVRRIVGRAVTKLSRTHRGNPAERAESLLSDMRVDGRLHAAKPARSAR